MVRSKVHSTLLALSLAALVTASSAPRAAEPEADPVLVEAITVLQSSIDRERFTEGLALAEAALRRYPRNRDFQYGAALCLAGLHRYREAIPKLESLTDKHPDRHDFRFKLAECLFLSGDVKDAMIEWGRFFNDPVSGEEAYARSVLALLATGREESARDLIREGLGRLGRDSEALLRYQLDLERRAPAARAVVTRLLPFDTAQDRSYEALEKVYAAAGESTIFEEEPLPAGVGITIPLDHFSDPREGTGLTMASGNLFLFREPARPILTCPVSINGSKTEQMMLDSGCPLVFLSPVMAEKLGIQRLAETQYGGLGGAGLQDSAWVLLDSLKVGPVTLRNVPAVLLSRSSDFWNVSPGIIPLSLFRNHAILYDPAAPSLTLFPPGTDPDTALPGGFSSPSLWFKGCPFVQTRVQGSEGLFLLADTGSYDTIASRTLGTRLTVLTSTARAPYLYRSGLSGTFTFAEALDVRFCLGRDCTRLSSIQVTPLGLRYGLPLAGILGRNFLDRYRIFFDYRQNIVRFKSLRN